MKKRILAMLLCLTMAMQLTGYVGADDGEEYLDEIIVEAEASDAETEPAAEELMYDVYGEPSAEEEDSEEAGEEVEIIEIIEEEATEEPVDEVAEIELVEEEEIILDINTELEAGAFGSDGVSTYDALMAAETLSDMYAAILANYTDMEALSEAEIVELNNKVEALKGEDPDNVYIGVIDEFGDYVEMTESELCEQILAIFAWLPNAPVESSGTEDDGGVYAIDFFDTFGSKAISTARENIQINLFNYGPQINTKIGDYALLPFINSEGSYGVAVDNAGNKPAGSAGGWPKVSTTLSDGQKFPSITENKDVIVKGSMGRLFDPNYKGDDRKSIETYKENIFGAENPYQYGSVYFPVNNSDGTGTGLFKKEGDYFVYDSGKNAAWYNIETGKFEIYDYVVRPAYRAFNTSSTNGNFLPFNQGHTQGREDYQTGTFTKKYTYEDASGKTVNAEAKDIAIGDTVSTKPTGALTAYRLDDRSQDVFENENPQTKTKSLRQREVDLWFGMTMEFDFYQPKDGQKSEKDMVFEFLGDDDVFVYIDNVLILDIGGTHGAQTGSINFASGVVNNPSGYGQYGTDGKSTSTLYELMKAALGEKLNEDDFIDSNGDTIKDTFKDYTKHNLKFFYLERGGNVSYCKLKFNLDPLPTGAVTVKKEEENIANEGEATYKFILYNEDPNVSEDETSVWSGTQYQLINADGTTDTQGYTLPVTGEFTLQGGQTAVFSELKVTDTFSVEEISEGNYDTSYKVNGGEVVSGVKTDTYTIDDGDDGTINQYNIVFTNAWKLTSLTLTKSGANTTIDPYQTFIFTVKGQDTNNSHIDMEVVVQGDSSITIDQLPVGNYEVSEDTDWSWRYELDSVTYNGESVTLNDEKGNIRLMVSEGNEVIFTNTREETIWLDGNTHCINTFAGTVTSKKDEEVNNP